MLLAAQGALLLLGVIAWGIALRRGRVLQWIDAADRLPPWLISGSDFLLFGLLVILFITLGPLLTARIFGLDLAREPTLQDTLIQGFSFQLSALAACLVFRVHPRGNPPSGAGMHLPATWKGIQAFVYVMPVFTAVVASSYWVMQALGLDPKTQDLIESFQQARTPAEILLLIVLATVLAPVTEELVFRAALFRFLHARIPTNWAMGISSILFALLHQNTLTFPPLVLLGCVLCFIYQKTGRLTAPITLHALFNLNSVLMVLFGPRE